MLAFTRLCKCLEERKSSEMVIWKETKQQRVVGPLGNGKGPGAMFCGNGQCSLQGQQSDASHR